MAGGRTGLCAKAKTLHGTPRGSWGPMLNRESLKVTSQGGSCGEGLHGSSGHQISQAPQGRGAVHIPRPCLPPAVAGLVRGQRPPMSHQNCFWVHGKPTMIQCTASGCPAPSGIPSAFRHSSTHPLMEKHFEKVLPKHLAHCRLVAPIIMVQRDKPARSQDVPQVRPQPDSRGWSRTPDQLHHCLR